MVDSSRGLGGAEGAVRWWVPGLIVGAIALAAWRAALPVGTAAFGEALLATDEREPTVHERLREQVTTALAAAADWARAVPGEQLLPLAERLAGARDATAADQLALAIACFHNTSEFVAGERLAWLDRGAAAAKVVIGRDDADDDVLASAWYLLGIFAAERDDGDAATLRAAAAAFERALELAPDDPSSLFQLAVVEEELGDDAAAARLYERIVALQADDVGAARSAALYRLCRILRRDPATRTRAAELFEKRDAMELAENAALRLRGISDFMLPDEQAALRVGQLGRPSPVPFQGSARTEVPAAAPPLAWRTTGTELDVDPQGLPSNAGDDGAAAIDLDLDGQLDRAVAVDGVLRLLHGEVSPSEEYLSDQRLEADRWIDWQQPLATVGRVAAQWVTFEDFDRDGVVDLLVGGAGMPTVQLRNLRRGWLVVRDARPGGGEVALPADVTQRAVCADLDHDGRVDLLLATTPPQLYRGDGRGGFSAGVARPELAGWWEGGATLLDVDGDGEIDFLGRDAGGRHLVRFGSLAAATAPSVIAAADGVPPSAGPALPVAIGVPANRWLELEFEGARDNIDGIGVVVEACFGLELERRMVRAPGLRLGLGKRGLPDFLCVTWPSGVRQYVDRAELMRADERWRRSATPPQPPRASEPDQPWRARIEQPRIGDGSCPFLYSWNGREYEFITDVLGTTPLGLPIDEARFVPPDHDELVRLAPGQAAPVDGEYRFQLTEELREVTYLDRARLLVVDHPLGTELHPEERFCFPPFPPPTLHVLRRQEPCLRVVDQDGRDWSAALAAVDGDHARPFRRLPANFSGLATAHHYELSLPAASRDAGRIRLALTGWFAWTNATANLNAARAGVAFVAPTLSVPDGAGGWRRIDPPLSFPAGKTKTMVIDVTPWVVRDDLRLRLDSTLELYWDAIAVALDSADEAALADPATQVTVLEADRAQLWHRGFSAPLQCSRGGSQPSRFDWNRLDPWPRGDQHAGWYTRYGEVVPLLGAVDDCFVLLGSGDAIDLRFDARVLPPPATGFTRTLLLDLDGWAKDGDPNTVHAQTVEPLPFHGMSGYPYRADEAFPDDPLHADWRAEWNTRPGRRLRPRSAR